MQLTKKRGLFEASRIVFLPVEEILPNPNQPRRNFDPESLRELSNSIARYGVLQPLSVRRRGRKFELVSGERRLRASKMADRKDVPCIILDVDAPESSILALVENLQRRDLDFIEEAEGLDRLVKLHGLSQETVARYIGKSQSAVANKLRILKLSGEMLYIIRESGLTERHARALLKLEDETDRTSVLNQIIQRGMNVAQTEDYIDEFQQTKQKGSTKTSQQVYIVKDIRFFLNTISKGMNMMKQSGIEAIYGKDETDSDIILTIKIPKKNTN